MITFVKVILKRPCLYFSGDLSNAKSWRTRFRAQRTKQADYRNSPAVVPNIDTGIKETSFYNKIGYRYNSQYKKHFTTFIAAKYLHLKNRFVINTLAFDAIIVTMTTST